MGARTKEATHRESKSPGCNPYSSGSEFRLAMSLAEEVLKYQMLKKKNGWKGTIRKLESETFVS